jgi:FtsH-binding integral membrane protein
MTTATRRTNARATTGSRATTDTGAAAGTRAAARFAVLPVPVAGAIAAAAGATVLYAYGALAQALSVPMRAGDPGASHAQAITPANFAVGVVFATVAGTILAMILAARAADPARAFLRTALVLVAVSLVFPLAASHTPAATRLTLALGHLIAAAIVIPLITLRLARARHPRAREPRNT